MKIICGVRYLVGVIIMIIQYQWTSARNTQDVWSDAQKNPPLLKSDTARNVHLLFINQNPKLHEIYFYKYCHSVVISTAAWTIMHLKTTHLSTHKQSKGLKSKRELSAGRDEEIYKHQPGFCFTEASVTASPGRAAALRSRRVPIRGAASLRGQD